MNISLYQIAQDIRECLDDAFDPETGEALPIFEERRALFGGKAQAVVAYMLNTQADASQCDVAIKRIKALRDVYAKKAEHLHDYLMHNMATSGITEIKADDGTFRARLYPGRDKSVEVFDAAQLPADYMREIPAKSEPDKTLIGKAIKDGFEVPGARLVAKDRLTIA